MRPIILALVSTALGACVPLGCGRAEADVLATDHRGVDAPSEPGYVGPLQRGIVLGGERIERVPRWPDTGGDPRVTLDMLDADSRRVAERATAPVLVPTGPWLAGLRLIDLGEHGHSLRARHQRSKVILQASRIARHHPELPPRGPGNQRIRGVDGLVTENEGIRSASWIENGTAYTADLECGDAAAPECSGDAGFVALLDDLAILPRPASVGGGR
ncbi:MAG: hypothetical protein H6711_27245 [Myxococcales bacterium]|nr:hypothetical protein [Myxococcales bacterium]